MAINVGEKQKKASKQTNKAKSENNKQTNRSKTNTKKTTKNKEQIPTSTGIIYKFPVRI